jgi:hypothetical protein
MSRSTRLRYGQNSTLQSVYWADQAPDLALCAQPYSVTVVAAAPTAQVVRLASRRPFRLDSRFRAGRIAPWPRWPGIDISILRA